MKKAFTIIEVLVAIGVLGIGVLGLATFYALSPRITREASNQTIAANLASGLVDEENAKSYEELAQGNGAKTFYTVDTNSPFHSFKKQINISLIDSNLNASVTDLGLKKIDVLIYYNSGNSEKNVQMSTIKTRR